MDSGDKLKEAETQENGLLAASTKMRDSLQILKEINNKANTIAFNAAIEGARTRGRLDSFAIVAEQIHTQAIRNGELSDQLEKLVQQLQNVALRSTSARYYELAEDLIDKLDRNLFERNCDVQAWATFQPVVKCAKELEITKAEEVKPFEQASESTKAACSLLANLMGIYVVYADIFLFNKNGVLIASGQHHNLFGKSYDKSEWFKEALEGKMNVTDMEHSDSLGLNAVNYSAPVRDEKGSIIGVLSTRFNWNYAQEMINSGGFDADVTACILNRLGMVIAATDEIGINRDWMDWSDAGRNSMRGFCGYTVETDRNGSPTAVGFARTEGYNAYRGKKWSGLVKARLGNVHYEHFVKLTEDRSNEEASAVKAQEGAKSERERIASEIANDELKETMVNINKLVSEINTTNNETNMLAINAAIQAGIAGTEGESFAVIASEIGNLAEKSVGFVQSVNKTAKELQQAVSDTVAARIADAARDSIDKVDRNLFERNCDVQAWATFPEVVSAAKNGDPSGTCGELLKKIHEIYEVYHDILLLDKNGKVIASAIRSELTGQNQGNRKWFHEAIKGKVNFTEVYRSESVNDLTMSFSAPVNDSNGNTIGVLSTRFNWKFIYDILDAVIVDTRSKVYLLNSEGVIIGSPERDEVLERSFKHLKAFRELSDGKIGHLIETDPEDKKEYAIGYCKTKGYNTYPGKSWSVIIRRPSENNESVGLEAVSDNRSAAVTRHSADPARQVA